MALSKRSRFEVLRRDNFTCRYCHETTTPLTIDHVLPVALGGTDEPTNLVTACRDCNAGKSSTAPDSVLVADVDADALRWSRARSVAIARLAGERADAEAARRPFVEAWLRWDVSGGFLPADWKSRIDSWLAEGILPDQLLDALDIALRHGQLPDHAVFRYMAGIVKNWITELDVATRQAIASELHASADDDDPHIDAYFDGQAVGYEDGWDDAVVGRPHRYRDRAELSVPVDPWASGEVAGNGETL